MYIDTFTWIKPKVYGEIPPPCRAHSAVSHGSTIYVFGGGDGPTYHNHFYALDTSKDKISGGLDGISSS